ncbi:PilZ domain-containing protein [Aestuariirhabdus sp. Z084]|uniref:PilZ domain-containing protein n=1 Tax=Aestuariirhabdus haliotis TaxID=2918751 RepID=UPI00201B3E13|nr:PilZ domain-containing protein [Aestuariirhabdus haliotis]MCL6416168.1 PilZ domain-containing protein [Aestuariirhabdus haliotis]MCL6420220.1 PilZ domain-containing protein [Aestuariirhabdus haliotis]
MQENRKEGRVKLQNNLDVYDCNTEKYMGSLVDISSDGFMLMSSEPIKTNTIFQCRINLPETVDDTDVIHIGVDSLWCKQSITPSHYWTGFHLIEINEKDRDIINRIMSFSSTPMD